MPAKPMNASKEPSRDICQSPYYAVYPIVNAIKRLNKIVWEPANGEGILSHAIEKETKLPVIKTDILDGRHHDFFSFVPDGGPYTVVTNPPYSTKYEWLKRLCELNWPFALLVPAPSMATVAVSEMYYDYGLQFTLMPRRVQYKMPNAGWSGGGAQFASMWITRKMGMQPLSYWDFDSESLKHLEDNPNA